MEIRYKKQKNNVTMATSSLEMVAHLPVAQKAVEMEYSILENSVMTVTLLQETGVMQTVYSKSVVTA